MALSSEQRDHILGRLAEGCSMSLACAEIGLRYKDLLNEQRRDSSFAEGVAQARNAGVEYQIDQMGEIARTMPDVQRAKLLTDNIKWVAARRLAQVYGDRLDLTVTERIDLAGALAAARARLRPVRDLQDVEDAQVIEAARLPALGASDTESLAREATAPRNELDLLFR